MMSNRLPSQRLLTEAMTAASELIIGEMRKDFLIISGVALVPSQCSSTCNTQDIA